MPRWTELLFVAMLSPACATTTTLSQGDAAPRFPTGTRSAAGAETPLADLHQKGPAVLVFLRGFS